jgi:hypothetical protein
MEIVPNLRPIVFWLKVRTRGPQPSICVPTFSQFTMNVLTNGRFPIQAKRHYGFLGSNNDEQPLFY